MQAGVEAYLALVRSDRDVSTLENAERSGTGECRVVTASLVDEPYAPHAKKRLDIGVRRVRDSVDRYYVCAVVYDAQRRPLAQCDSRLSGVWSNPDGDDVQNYSLELRTPWLKPGRHEIDVFVCNHGILDAVTSAVQFEVTPSMPYEFGASEENNALAPVLADFEWIRGGSS